MDGQWQLAAAAALARKAVASAPGQAEALMTLAEVLSCAGQHSEAASAAQAAVKARPDSLLNRARRAKVLLRAGAYEAAATAFAEVLEHAPPFGWPIRYLAFSLHRLGREQQALDTWLRHIDTDRGFSASEVDAARQLVAAEGAAGHWRWRLGTIE